MSLYEEITGKKEKKKKKQEKYVMPDWVGKEKVDIAPVKSTQSSIISDETKNFAKSTILDFLGNKFKVNDFKNIWSNGYDFGDIKKTIDTAKSIISPQEQIKQKVSSTITDLAQSDGKLFKENKAIKDTKDALKNTWSNGYQFGDIYKSKNAIQSGITKTILGTTADVGTNLLKGELQTAEGLVDTGRYVASDLVKWAGYEDTAKGIKDRAIQNTTGFILGENDLYNNPKQDGWAKKLDEYSIFGDKIDQINQSLGQQAFRIGLSKALMGSAEAGSVTEKGVNAFNQLEIFAGSYGQAKSEALMNGADEKTANLRGLISGTTEYISENLFDSLPGFKTGELKGATKLKDLIGKSAEKAFGKNGGKAVLRLFGGLGEGFEEILSNVLDTTFTDTLNYVMPEYTYGMKEGQGLREADNILWKQIKDIVGSSTSEESKEAFITSLISTFITGATTDYANTQQRNEIIKGYAQDNNISVEKATQLFDAISELRQKQLVDENTGFTERMATEENVNQQLQQEIQNGANLEELFEQTPKTRQESQFVFTNDEKKNIKSDRQKELAKSLENINNTKEVHEIFDLANRIQGANDDIQLGLTTTEGLYRLGYINKTEDGRYVSKTGQEYIPRGLNDVEGKLLINVDVGTQSGTQAMYHEIFEGFKKSAPEQYNQFKQMVSDIIGEDNIQNEVNKYIDMYKDYYPDMSEEKLKNTARDEIINDKFGELAENQKFINRIADNRSVLEKFVDSIKNMIKYVKGTPQERQLIKLQNKLEKEFAKRYKKTDFSQNEGETAYSISTDENGEPEINVYHGTSLNATFKIQKNGMIAGSAIGADVKSDANYNYFTNSRENAESYKVRKDRNSGQLLRVKKTSDMQIDDRIEGHKKGNYDFRTQRTISPEEIQILTEDGYWTPLTNYDLYTDTPANQKVIDKSLLYDDAGNKVDSKAVNNTAFSLQSNKDSNGRTLSKEQQSYFKDSKVVDEDGNLKVMYHSGKSGNYNIIDFNKVGDNTGYDNTAFGYFITDSKLFSERFKDINNEGNKGYTKEFYANIKKPIIHPFQAWLKYNKNESDDILRNYLIETNNLEALNYLEEQVRLNNDGETITDIYAYLSTYEEEPFENAKQEKEILQSKGYDAVEFIEGEESSIAPDSKSNKIISSYAIFNSNQVKNVDNLNPTENADIRYSLTQRVDSELDDISDQQYNYFKNTKAVDQDGELEVVHHGTGADFNIFDIEKAGQTGLVFGNGFYFTNSSGNASMFAGDEGDVKSGYINIEKPASRDTKTMSYNEFKQLYNALNQNQNLYDEEMGMSNIDALLSDYGDIYSDKENVIKTFYDSYDNDVNLIDNLSYMSNPTEMYKTLRDTLGYDGIIVENPTGYDAFEKYYIAFNPDQFKLKTNQNPTNNVDMRLSLTRNDNIRSREIAPVNTTTEEQLAPIREDISNISTQLDNLSNQIENLQNGLENNPRGYVESYKEQRNENIPTRQLTEDEANLRQEALMQDEGYLRSLEEQADYDANEKFIKTLTNEIQPQLEVSKEKRPTLENLMRDAVENDLTLDEISDRIHGDFGTYKYTLEDDGIKEVKARVRKTPLKVSDHIKRDIADYGAFQKSNFGKMTFSKSGLPVDVAYQELVSEYPGYFDDDIINETDQLLKISEIANRKGQTFSEPFDTDYLENIADYIHESVLNYKANNQLDSQASLNKDIQFDFTEDVAPTTIRTQESIDEYIDNRDIAPVRQKDVKPKSKIRDRLERMRTSFNEKIRNRNYIIDEYSRATGNKEIKFTGDNLNNVSGEASYNINGHQTDMYGNEVGKGVHEIFQPARKAGKYEAFNDYLVQKSNIERHAVGKGSKVPLVVSQQLVQQYEAENPEFIEWAKPVYKYFDNVLQDQVDSGLITQDRYNDYRGENGIYRSYVPFYPGEETQSNIVFGEDGEVKSYNTLKKSKGNADDVNKMLSVEDAMARQTYAYKRAIRQNELYKQIVNSSEKYDAMFDGDLRDNPTNLDDSLFADEEGNKILSAYVNGQKVSAMISDDLYNELSGENEQRIKQIEQDFSLITNPLQKASNIRRKLITTWNPAFLVRNAIKDVQDAVINSKHTGKMLKNLTGNGNIKKTAIYELYKADTKEAKQFLALYGSELYGDYSGKMNKFTKLNELIELAPRYAEYKASLQSGESQNEAMYNAREVTTNFGRGGYVTRALNRNGFTFLNANVQGLDKVVRNLSGENGAKGVVAVVTKGALFAVLPSILNDLLYGFGDDKDEEYEALPDYIKDNYYLIKTEGNHFVRIPKGRINAVFGSMARRTIESVETGENQFDGYIDNAWSQIGVGDLGGNNIFSPLTQAFGSENGKAWYGGDIVPTRLQNKPAEEQTDAKIDSISNFIGETFNISPYKVNYVIDQYSGAIGDMLLPYITPETKTGAEGLGQLTAPLKDAFVVNSTDDNKYAGEFYDLKDKLEKAKNSSKATDEDVLKYKYMEGISKQLSDLYKERREVQSDTTLGNSVKYEKVQKIQDSINSLAKEGVKNYQNIIKTEGYSHTEDSEFYKNSKNEWTKVSDSDAEFTAGLTDSEKNSYYNVKNKIGVIYDDYNKKTKGLTNETKKKQYSAEKKDKITEAIVNSGLDNYTKAMVYSKYYSSDDTMTNVYNSGYDIDTYITAKNDLDHIRDKYSQKKGYSTEYRKNKTISYINSLDMEIPQKAMLIREYYTSFRSYNNDIVNFVSELDISYEEKVAILKGTGMTVKGNNVSWK